jgi:hypothetical protein
MSATPAKKQLTRRSLSRSRSPSPAVPSSTSGRRSSGGPAAAPPPGIDECLRAFCWVWGLSQPLQLNRGSLTARGPFQLLQAALCAGVAVWPSRWLLALALVGRLCQFGLRMPYTFDSDVLQMLLNAAVLLHVLVSREGPASQPLGETTRRMLGVFYVFAGGWKLNTSFLDYRYSCASTYFAQLIDAYVPLLGLAPSAELVALAVQASPWLTLVLECSVGVTMLLADLSPRWGYLALVLASALHLGIDITPKPNNIASFSHACGIAYMWFAPTGVAAAVQEVKASPLVAGACYGTVGAAFLGLTIYAQQPELLFEPGQMSKLVWHRDLDLHAASHPMLTALLFRALYLGGSCAATAVDTATGLPMVTTAKTAGHQQQQPGRASRLVSWVLVATTFSWACLSIVFGVMEMNSPNMFSNVRLQGGSNHLLLPTGLLQQAYYEGWQATENPFGGGIIRIEATDSTWINGMYPAEYTPVLTDGTQQLLRDAGHSGRHFNSLITRVVGAFAVPSRPPGSAFVKYTLPAFEVRRLLKEARQHNESFSLEYSHLPGAVCVYLQGNHLFIFVLARCKIA